MKRYKRLAILAGILVVACVITFAVSQYEERKEEIKTTDAVILSLDSQTVQTIAWETEEQSLAFHREDGTWFWDEDSAFPVDEEKMEELLGHFASFGAAFIIENVENFGQYGLDDPVCTISMTTDEDSYEVLVGEFSTMDQQRYVSIGDGNVYLVNEDPAEAFDVAIEGMIDNDDAPTIAQAQSIVFTGEDGYQVTYQAEGGVSYRGEDVYFTQLDNGETLPLDTQLVEGYLSQLEGLSLTDYVTYNATEEEIQACGLDDPEFTVSVEYTWTDEDDQVQSSTFLLQLSRDPEELAAAGDDEEALAEVTAYARVGQSKILYQITADEYDSLTAASRNDLRHQEVLPADLDDISKIDVTLDGQTYTITAEQTEDGPVYSYGEETLEDSDLEGCLEALTATSFTDEQPTQQEELTLTIYPDVEGDPSVTITFYRYNGTDCLAVVDGSPLCLVQRSAVIDLVEAVNGVVLE